MENWMNHPAMKTIDPLKLELIRTAAKQTKGKSGNELAPVMLALITNANRQGLRFNPDEVSLILEVLKEGKSKEEQNQIDRMMEMNSCHFIFRSPNRTGSSCSESHSQFSYGKPTDSCRI